MAAKKTKKKTAKKAKVKPVTQPETGRKGGINHVQPKNNIYLPEPQQNAATTRKPVDYDQIHEYVLQVVARAIQRTAQLIKQNDANWVLDTAQKCAKTLEAYQNIFQKQVKFKKELDILGYDATMKRRQAKIIEGLSDEDLQGLLPQAIQILEAEKNKGK